MSRSTFILACTLSAAATAVPIERVLAAADVLATVRITAAVMADGKPLPSGTYEVRLVLEGPGVCPCESPDVQRWVEFVANGKVVGREIAQILRDDKLPAVGASSKPVRNGTQVEWLKGGEFLRISIKRERERYLIYLPLPS